MSDPRKTQEGGKHYLSMRIQPERFIYENAIGFHEGNVIKYVCRHKSKGGVTDLRKARHYLDLLIAHYENDECFGQPEPEPPAPAPELPRLNTGWKWAEVNKHEIGKYDMWVRRDRTMAACIGDVIGSTLRIHLPLATPDWHNPENIAEPGEGWRFLVKGEKVQDGDEYMAVCSWWAGVSIGIKPHDDMTYRTPATRPLPPVLADEKEAQP